MSGQELAEPSIGNVIFLSYRRDDTLAQTMALKLELERKLSAADVFMDYRAIAPGNDFANQIENALRVAKVILVIIGPNWEGKGKGLIDRIQSTDDWVNKEVSFALQSKRKCVIPILMDRDSPPSAPNLPASLSSLAELQALQIRMQDIDAQMRVLLQLL